MESFEFRLFSNLFLYSLLTCIYCSAIEPSCSKFPYEEALLEKMIRLEFDVGKMLESIQDAKMQMTNELEKSKAERELAKQERDDFGIKIENERSDFEKKVRQMESDATNKVVKLADETQSKLINLEKDVNDNLEHAESVISRLSEDLRELRNGTIQELIETTKKPTVLFRARNVDDLSPTNKKKLVFETVLVNQGDSYNKDTGIFTAAVAGEYLFSVQICSHGSTDVHLAFVQDGVRKQPIEFINNSYACGTAVFVTYIKVQTEIWIESTASHGSNVLYTDSFRWNVFSGILIR